MTATGNPAPVTAGSGMSGAATVATAGTTPAPSAAATEGNPGTTPAGSPAATPAGSASQAAPQGASGAVTASEAAARYAQAQLQHGGGSDSRPAAAGSPESAEDNSCATDADCGFTRVAAGGCCPMLCAPRVVSKKQADALQKHVGSCRRGQLCPEPLCRPPLGSLTPSCQEHRCVGTPIQRRPGADD